MSTARRNSHCLLLKWTGSLSLCEGWIAGEGRRRQGRDGKGKEEEEEQEEDKGRRGGHVKKLAGAMAGMIEARWLFWPHSAAGCWLAG